MTSLLNRFDDTRRSVGLGRTLAALPLWSFGQRFVVASRDLDRPAEELLGLDGLQRSVLEPGLLERVVDLNPRLTEVAARRRLEEGQSCELWWLGEAIAQMRWYGAGPMQLPFLDLELHPLPGDVTVFEVYTVPQFRRRGLQTATFAAFLERSRSQGLKRVIAFRAWWHHPSERVFRRFGCEELGAVTRWQLGPLRHHTWTGRVQVEEGRLHLLK